MTDLAIYLPALNEAASIASVIDGLPSAIPGISKIIVIVVDDGSVDDTGSIARSKGVMVVRHERTGGVGRAFRSGLAKAIELGVDIMVSIDSDGQFNPADIEKLMVPILNGEADFVTASRFKDPALMPQMPGAKVWGNRQIARMISHMTGHQFYDVSCGFRAYGRKAFLRLDPQGDFTYTHEVFLALAFGGLRIKEVPVVVRGVREHGESRIANNLFRYGWSAASIILGTYRDYRPLVFFGSIAAILFFTGFVILFLLGLHWWNTGALFPYRAFGFAGGALCGAGLLVYLVGLVAAMLARLRSGIETALYRAGEAERLLRKQ